MKKTLFALTPLLFATLLLFGCFTPRAIKGNASSSLTGKTVDFKKMMNPSFAEDYIDADVITSAEFYDPNPSKYDHLKMPKGHLAFQVLPIGGKPNTSVLGGAETGYHVFIPKSEADGIFDIEKGTRIELRGGTHVTKTGGLGISHKTVNFKATSMSVK